MPSICGNCGSHQGPFERSRIGVNKKNMDPIQVVCAHGPIVKDGKGYPHGQGTLDCLARRAKQDDIRWGHDLPTVVHVTR